MRFRGGRLAALGFMMLAPAALGASCVAPAESRDDEAVGSAAEGLARWECAYNCSAVTDVACKHAASVNYNSCLSQNQGSSADCAATYAHVVAQCDRAVLDCTDRCNSSNCFVPGGAGISNWEAWHGAGVVPFNGCGLGNAAFDYSPLPAKGDPGWTPTQSSSLDFQEPSAFCAGPSCVSCGCGGKFTHLRTFADIPVGANLGTFSVALSNVDDLVRVLVRNSYYPAGVVVTGSYVGYSGGPGSGTANVAPYLVAGERNEIVVSQVDLCGGGSRVSAQIVQSGEIDPSCNTCQKWAVGLTPSPWRKWLGSGPVAFSHTMSSDGAIEEFAYASIPAFSNTGWASTGSTLLDFWEASAVGACRASGEFNYFVTDVDIPARAVLGTFAAALTGVDDGARVSVYNSDFPAGVAVAGGHVKWNPANGGSPGTGTVDVAPYLVAGQKNTIVVTQVDDCGGGSGLQAQLVFSGQTQQYCAPQCNGSSTGINLETRYFAPGSTLPTTTAQAASIFAALPAGVPGYGAVSLSDTAAFSNHTSIPSGVNHDVAYHLKATIAVNPPHVGDWGFRLGPDYGYGGTLLVDGVEVQARWGTAGDGMYWGGSWADPAEILQVAAIHLGTGLHTIETYGFENGTDAQGGPLMRLEVLAPGVDPGPAWAPLSMSTVNLCAQ
jgi:hypothetical protein